MKRPLSFTLGALAVSIITVSIVACSDNNGTGGSVQPASAAAASAPTTNAMPPVVTVKLPQSAEEKHFLDDNDDEAFDRAILKANPDIRRAPFKPDGAVVDDKDTTNMYRLSYHRGLYFAKQIRLADGSTLYDFLANCARTFNYLDGADRGAVEGDMSHLDLRYYAVLRRRDTGADIEVTLSFDRAGDEVRGTTGWAQHALRDADFRDEPATCRSASDHLVTKSIDF